MHLVPTYLVIGLYPALFVRPAFFREPLLHVFRLLIAGSLYCLRDKVGKAANCCTSPPLDCGFLFGVRGCRRGSDVPFRTGAGVPINFTPSRFRFAPLTEVKYNIFP